MQEKEALHTAARRYCIERAAMWERHYFAGANPSAAATIFPRYHVLIAILGAVEHTAPADFETVEDLRGALVRAGQTAIDAFIRGRRDAGAALALVEERDLFRRYVRRLSARDLRGIAPLPHRRPLRHEESTRIWDRVQRRWGMERGASWRSLLTRSTSARVIAFAPDPFGRYMRPPELQAILAGHGIGRVWQLHDYGVEYEIDLALLEPTRAGAEGYWTSGDAEWLLCASYEGPLIVAGDWLNAAITAAWARWERYLYTDAEMDAGTDTDVD